MLPLEKKGCLVFITTTFLFFFLTTPSFATWCQGYRVCLPNKDQCPGSCGCPANAPITADGHTETSQPYYIWVAPGTRTISISPVEGFDISYSLCIDCYTHDSWVPGNSLTFESNSSFYDLWWGFQVSSPFSNPYSHADTNADPYPPTPILPPPPPPTPPPEPPEQICLDQSQTYTDAGVGARYVGQSFTPSVTADFVFFDFCMSPDLTHKAELIKGENVDGEVISATEIEFNTRRDCYINQKWVRFYFSDLPPLSSGETYFVKITYTSQFVDTPGIALKDDVYPNGKAFVMDEYGSGGFRSDDDYMFREYYVCDSVVTTPTPPPICNPTTNREFFDVADANCDGVTNDLDYVLWWKAYEVDAGGDFYPQGGDGQTNEDDYQVWLDYYGAQH